MAHQPKALIYIEFKFKNEAVPPFQHMNECALTWLTEWHGEMLLHHSFFSMNSMYGKDKSYILLNTSKHSKLCNFKFLGSR
jgi:hypothetical protein